MTVPTIHLNGTSAQSLLNGYFKAHRAAMDAIEALARTAPNGRDYYVQEDTAIDRAKIEHDARMRRLRDVIEELEAIICSIQEQAGV